MFKIDDKLKRIELSQGDTMNLTVDLSLASPDIFTGSEVVVFGIKTKTNQRSCGSNFGNNLIEKVYQITVGTNPSTASFTISLTNEESQQLPVGEQLWDFRIVFNPIYDGSNNVISGAEVITPFAPAVFHVVDVVANV